MRTGFFAHLLTVILALAIPAASAAQEILSVTTADGTRSFTREDLLAMPQTTITTSNDYL